MTIVKRLVLLAVLLCSAAVFSACHANKYNSPAAERIFRWGMPQNARRDHQISTMSFVYALEDRQAPFSKVSLFLKSGDRLLLQFTGKNPKNSCSYRMIGGKVYFSEGEQPPCEVEDPYEAAAVRFLYDVNFHTPEYVARSVSLRSEVPELLNNVPCYVFDVVPRRDYAVDTITYYVDAKKLHTVRMEYAPVQDDPEDKVVNLYSEIIEKDGIPVSRRITSTFLGAPRTMLLEEFKTNTPIPDQMFALPDTGAANK